MGYFRILAAIPGFLYSYGGIISLKPSIPAIVMFRHTR